MTENKEEDAVQGSKDSSTTPCEVSKRDENAPVAAGDGRDSREELTWGLQHIPEEPSEDLLRRPVTESPNQEPAKQIKPVDQAPQPARQPAPESVVPEPVNQIKPVAPDQQPTTQVMPENPFRETVKQVPVNPAQRPAKQAAPKSPAPEPAKQIKQVKPAQKPAKEAPEAVSKTLSENSAQESGNEVFRKTELHSAPPVIEEDTELRTLRKKMLLKLRRPKCEVSFLPYETAFREFIASLMVRQDKTDAELRPQIAALWEQVKILEKQLDWKTARLGQRMDELEERERL